MEVDVPGASAARCGQDLDLSAPTEDKGAP
jgi:hypothetical protein